MNKHNLPLLSMLMASLSMAPLLNVNISLSCKIKTSWIEGVRSFIGLEELRFEVNLSATASEYNWQQKSPFR
jgi:hypothetical protein